MSEHGLDADRTLLDAFRAGFEYGTDHDGIDHRLDVESAFADWWPNHARPSGAVDHDEFPNCCDKPAKPSLRKTSTQASADGGTS